MSKKTYDKIAELWKTNAQPKVDKLAAQAIPMAKKGWATGKEHANSLKEIAVPFGITALEEGRKKFAELSATLSQGEILKWLETITEGTATVYDKALDATYLKEAIGGGNHRLFDGGHDLFSAWARAKEALPDDSFSQEVLGYLTALWKDGTTLKGLPFQTLDKADYDGWAKAVTDFIPGISKNFLYDLCSFDALEICSSGIGVVAIIFAFKKEDKKRLAEMLGAMGITSIASANPIMGLVTITATAYAYFIKKQELDKTLMFKSGAIAAMSAFIFSVVGLPFLMELVLVAVLAKLVRTHVLDNDELLADLKKHLYAAASTEGAQIQKFAKSILDKFENFSWKATGTKS